MAADTTTEIPSLSAPAPPTAAAPGTRRLGLALIVISMAQLMLVLDELIVNTALPHIQQALHFSGTSLEWVVTGYAVTFGGLLMLGGRAGDIFGRRRMLSAGILAFSLASLAGGLATTSWLLITARVVQGAGAAVAAPAALSLITVTFPEGKLRTRALGVYAAMTGMGGGVGVVAGGLLTTYASWRWVFFVNVPLGALLAFGARVVLPESQRYPRRWDLPGAVTGTAGFALLIYGLTRGATGPDGISHWGDTATILALTGAAAALTAFVAIEARSAQPLLPLWIFADRNRAGVYLILLCLASVFFGMFFFLTLFTQVVWGYSALRGGLAYLPFIGGFIVIAGICTKLVTRVGARVPMTIGAVLAPASMFWLSRVHEHSHYVTGVMLPLLVFAITAGLIFVPLTMTLVAGISDEHAGIASSMFNAGQQVGGAVGLAVIGSVAWTIVNNHVRHALARVPAGHAAAAGHAVLAASPLYHRALTAGVDVALTIGAAATVVALIVTLVAIRVRREDLPASPLPHKPLSRRRPAASPARAKIWACGPAPPIPYGTAPSQGATTDPRSFICPALGRPPPMVTSELPRPPLAEPHEVGGPERYDSYRGTSSERARARGTARFRSLGAREKWGYGVWLFAGLVFGVPESWAGIANPPWPALSDTIAHLESLWAPTAVIVVAPLVFIAFPVIRYALVQQGCAATRDLPGRQPAGPGRLSGPGPAAIGRASALAYLPAGLQASPLWQLHAASEQPRLSSQKWVI